METAASLIGRARIAAGVVLLALVAGLYGPTFGWLYERYTAADSYYSHGFIVPVVTCVLIWMRRERLSGVALSANGAGLALCCAALVVHAAGLLFRVNFASGFSLLFLVIGSVLFLFGSAVTKLIFQPLVFLGFMLPLPLVAVNSISFPLKEIVAVTTAFILKHMCGIPLRLEGFQLIFPRAALTIENPCSGLRSAIVMLALGYVFACLSDATRWKRVALFFLSVPVAVASNILRVMLLSLGVYVYGEGAAHGFFHDFTGYCAFAAAFACMYGFWRAFQCRS